jgi:rhodanese-related sulfurtransferase
MKKKYILVLVIFLLNSLLFAQNPEGFEEMADKMAGKDAPVILAKDLSSKKAVIYLDSREKEEYEISHLPGAVWIGYDHVEWKRVLSLPKDANIVVYCSVGFRSGKITEKLNEKGYKNAYNLYGGLFNYANFGGQLIDGNGRETTKVHGYSKKWSKWLNPEMCIPIY